MQKTAVGGNMTFISCHILVLNEYFTLINLNLNLKFFSKDSFSLLLNLLALGKVYNKLPLLPTLLALRNPLYYCEQKFPHSVQQPGK